jgi:hypothetical protein
MRKTLIATALSPMGRRVVYQLSDESFAAFPDMKGLSVSHLKYMRHFALECRVG